MPTTRRKILRSGAATLGRRHRLTARLRGPLMTSLVAACCAIGCERSSHNSPPSPAANRLPPAEESRDSTVHPTGSIASDEQASRVTHVGRSSETMPDPSQAGRQLLRRVLAHYRSARSYHDHGEVQLQYRLADKLESDRIPLAVHYIAPDKLTVEAYPTRLEWRGNRLRAFVDAAEVNRLDRQLLQMQFSEARVHASRLYRDPVLAHFTAAGPAGPAPQVEMLLGNNPLAGLLAAEARFEPGGVERIDDRPCQSLVVSAGETSSVVWIDPEALLIRRIDLPRIDLPPPQTGGESHPSAASVTVRIDFVDAEIDGPSRPVENHLQGEDWLVVDTLTVPPPPLMSSLVGRRPAPFRLEGREAASRNEKFAITERGSDRPHTILLWTAQHAGSQRAIDQLAQIADGLPQQRRRNWRMVVVQAEPAMGSSPRQVKTPPVLAEAHDTTAIGRDRFEIEEAPALCVLEQDGLVQWLQSPVGPEMTTTLNGLMTDREAGIDVGRRLREQHENDLQTYHHLLSDRTIR